jgi:hypothetical protein
MILTAESKSAYGRGLRRAFELIFTTKEIRLLICNCSPETDREILKLVSESLLLIFGPHAVEGFNSIPNLSIIKKIK